VGRPRRFGRVGFIRVAAIVAGTTGASLALGPEAQAVPLTLHVNPGSASCSDTYARATAADPATPWCSLGPAATMPEPGDTVVIEPATYSGTFSPLVSGTVDAPITYAGGGVGVVLDGAGATATVKIVAVVNLSLQGLEVRGASSQGVWVSGSSGITLSSLTVADNPGHGVQIKNSSGVAVTGSVIENNGMAGIFEATGTTGGTYMGDVIAENGINGDPYNGDGIQLNGSGAVIEGNTITGNGDPGPYEHGIYAGPIATGYLIEGNTLNGNAGSNVKAAGSGIVRYNDIQGGRMGVVLVDNTGNGVSVYYNLIHGQFQHPVFLTTDHIGAAIARLWNNTIVSDGRTSTSTGDTSAVYINYSSSLDMRNNVICYRGSDGSGVAVRVPDRTRAGGFTSDYNWFCTPDRYSRHFTVGSRRMTLAKWRQYMGQDRDSFASGPLNFSSELRLPPDKWGTALGTPLGLIRDYVGTPVPATGRPTMGAYQQ
jgi:parallel beta-helix repeat protein